MRPAPSALLPCLAALLAGLVLGGCGADAGSGETPAPSRAAAFLQTYVDPDGRVVRRDQGGDTVSEGQAYAMLLAVVEDDQETFDRVWGWTRDHLTRPEDGLFSWHWANGAVIDPTSASDAEIDMARALVVAADAFGDPDYADEGVALGTAVLDHLTVEVPEGLLLVPGQWARDAPYDFNPSYVSPVTAEVLGEASGDPRWESLADGSRAALEALLAQDPLPPNWAEVAADGSARPVPSPDGSAVEYGYDAARTPLRLTESCDDADHDLAAGIAEAIAAHDGDPVATYDLAGSPTSDLASPLVTMGQAAGLAASGDDAGAEAAAAMDLAAQQADDAPTYYGDAWVALGRALLTDPVLGGCPPLEG